MEKNQVDAILVAQAKRKKIILSFIISIIIISALAGYILYVCLNENKQEHVNYIESSNIDYQVNLKENDFFAEDHLEADNQYIASLIENIDANFNYNVSMDKKDFNYTYTYKILAYIDVRGKTINNSLYNFTETIVEGKTKKSNGSANVEINENVIIDYNHYNDIINRFISTYDLNDTVSTLTLSLYVDLKGEYDTESKSSVISLDIPLTTKTVTIDITSDLVQSDNKYMIYSDKQDISIVKIAIMIVLVVIDIILIVRAYMYASSSRTDETVYDNALKKILNNYHSYIQKVNNEFDLSEYKILKIDTFRELIEVRETLQKPILMVENAEKTETIFVIITDSNVAYMYELRLSNIKTKKEVFKF